MQPGPAAESGPAVQFGPAAEPGPGVQFGPAAERGTDAERATGAGRGLAGERGGITLTGRGAIAGMLVLFFLSLLLASWLQWGVLAGRVS